MNTKNYALITGGSKGIGFELAKEFAKNKFNLILVARSKPDLLKAKSYFIKHFSGINIIIISQDLSKPEASKKILKKTSHLGVVALVNNAGFGDFGLFNKSNLEKQTNMIQTNINSLTSLTHLYVQDMIKNNYGFILNVSSVAGFQPGPLMSVYYASKAYVLSFTQSIANELKHTNIKISVLCPGATKTNFVKSANLNRSTLFSKSSVTSPTYVAKLAYKQLNKNKTIIVPGFKNKLLIFLNRFISRNLTTDIVHKMQDYK